MLDKASNDYYINKLFDANPVKLNGVASNILLRELYDIEMYNIDRNSDLEHLFGVVLLREEEILSDFNPLRLYITEYVKLNLGETFNISLDEFLNYSFYMLEELKPVAETVKETNKAYFNDNKLKTMFKGIK